MNRLTLLLRTRIAFAVLALGCLLTTGASAQTKVVTVEGCGGALPKITLGLTEESIQFEVPKVTTRADACLCHESADELKKIAVNWAKGTGSSARPNLPRVNLAPGETKTGTFYCYDISHLQEIQRGIHAPETVRQRPR